MDVRVHTCFHCDEPLGPLELHQAGGESFCCAGCAAAAAWIKDSALFDYYRLRSAPGRKPDVHANSFLAWDGDQVIAEHTRKVDGALEITVLTDAMQCAACAWLLDRALRNEPGVLDAGANAISGRVMVRWDPETTLLSTLMSRMAALGYAPALATGEARERDRREKRRTLLTRLGIAWLGAMQAMMFAEALYLDTRGDMSLATRDFFRWVTMLVATPVVFYSGWPFIEGMFRELRARRLGMDCLVAGATLLAYFASVVETLRGGRQVWFDAAVMFVALLLLARMLEQRARQRASAHVDALARVRPAVATREAATGGLEEVPLVDIGVGDILRTCLGEAVPADGVLLDAGSSFDESLLTGESLPVDRQPGEEILAGSLCRGRVARLRVIRTGSETRLSELSRLVDQAQRNRPALARTADRVAAWFVGALFVCAIAVYAWWHVHEPSRALEVTLALLVVSCPCALSLAIPAALTAAHGRLAAIGVLVLSADALANLARVDTVVFDKTGTLTSGRPTIASMEEFRGMGRARALAIAAALERGSRHPLSGAFASDDRASPVASDVRESPASGLEGRIDGTLWRIGRAGFAAARDDDEAIWLGDGSQAFARFDMRESSRGGTRAAVSSLQALGIAIEISSGDAESAVRRIADEIAVPSYLARQAPERKLGRLRQLQAAGHVVAMVGDGINDAPVLAGADVSLAMAEGATLAQRAADIVLTSPSLQRLPQAIVLARKTARIIRQNMGWAMVYNLVALPLAAAGSITPLFAAGGMALSSLTVVLNSLRLARTQRE